MCELFGVSASKKIMVNPFLQEFFSHSDEHPNGWGMAFFFGNAVSLEKEPVKASGSSYLKARLGTPIEVHNLIAHIRFATVGNMEYGNSHPFVKRDQYGRCYTLAHNGTIFHYPALSPYFYEQEGSTDSERILLFLVDKIEKEQDALGRALRDEERFDLLDSLVSSLASGNKLNLLLFDGVYLYVHTNYANSLYMHRQEEGLLFATSPLSRAVWTPHPFTALCAYKDGQLVFRGTDHGREYRDNEKDWKFVFLDYTEL